MLRSTFAAATLLGAAITAQGASFVIPAAQATALGNTVNGFPFSYTQYVRFQQAIATSHFPNPTLLFGLALRPTTPPLNVPEVQKQSLIVELADSTVAPGSLSGNYPSNAGANMARVFDGRINLQRPNRFDPLEFVVLIPFRQFYLHTNQNPLLVDMQPTAFENLPCLSGGNGTGFDAVRLDPGIWSVAGKHPQQLCATPTSGGQIATMGFVFKFFSSNVAMPYGKACRGSNGLLPSIGSNGSASVGNGTFALTLGNLAAQVTQTAFLIGDNDQLLGSLPLPFELGGLGMPDCYLSTNILLAIPVPAAAGSATLPLGIPNDPTLSGLRLLTEGAAVDLGANANSVITTQGATFTIR